MKLSEIIETVESIIEEAYANTLKGGIDPSFARFDKYNANHYRRVSRALQNTGVNLDRDWYDEKTGRGKFRVGLVNGRPTRVYRYDRFGNESVEFIELHPLNRSVPDVD